MQQQEQRLSFEKVFRRSWPALLFGALLCVGLSLLVFQLAVRGSFRTGDAEPVAEAEEPQEMERRLLDGVAVEPGQERGVIFSAMIDNSPDAWPLAGPADANLVIEAPVEGGITRLFLVFAGSSTVDVIGPVRSARPYYVAWAESLGALYAHVGGSPEALKLIRSSAAFRDLDEFSNPYRFERSPKRAMPHNTFTSTEELAYFAAFREWETSDFTPWAYAPASERGEITDIRIPYGGPWSVRWEYDRERDEYLRYQGDGVQKDVDGAEVRVKNVVVLRTQASVVDDVGRLDLTTTGTGEATVFRNGNRIDGTWVREAGEWIRFEDSGGNPIPFEPGTTWISVVTSKDQMP